MNVLEAGEGAEGSGRMESSPVVTECRPGFLRVVLVWRRGLRLARPANYAAGNAFLDALSQYRRVQHLPGTSINWGAWSDVGMAARLDRRDRVRLSASGVAPIDPAGGIDALREIMRRDRAQVAVLPIDWTAFARQFDGPGVPPIMAELARRRRDRWHRHLSARRPMICSSARDV